MEWMRRFLTLLTDVFQVSCWCLVLNTRKPDLVPPHPASFRMTSHDRHVWSCLQRVGCSGVAESQELQCQEKPTKRYNNNNNNNDSSNNSSNNNNNHNHNNNNKVNYQPFLGIQSDALFKSLPWAVSHLHPDRAQLSLAIARIRSNGHWPRTRSTFFWCSKGSLLIYRNLYISICVHIQI